MHPLIEKRLKKGPVGTDGSWGTQLQNRGLKRGECPDSWNLNHPELVEEVAGQYVEAGSQIILTNTFGGSRLSLGRFKMGEKAVAINTAGVEISKRAAGSRAYVFASIGPTGKMLLTKETTEEELQNAFEEQADAQARAGADGIIFASASFCDPALLDRPMLQARLTEEGIGHTAFKYADNSGQMQPIREQAGTFADSIKLWSAA